MTYTVKFLNNKTGKTLVSDYPSYMAAYRALSNLAYTVGYEVHSIHGDMLVTAGTMQTKYLITLMRHESDK